MQNEMKKNAMGYSSQATGHFPSGLSPGKKLVRWLGEYKWLLIGLMWVVTIVLGYIGFSRYFSTLGETHSFWNTLYRTLQLFVLESGFISGAVEWEFQIARYLAPAITAYTAMQALAILFQEQLRLFRIRFFKDHIVICGLGQKGWLLSRGFRERDEQVVVIEKDVNNSFLGQCREQGATILIGDAADPVLLRKARVNKARYVISVCGDDGANAEVAVHSRELVWNRRGKALSCLSHISDFRLCNLLREREIKLGKMEAFRLELFNVFESGARILLDEYPPFGKTGEENISGKHLVIAGLGRMGESLAVNAARNWWDLGGRDGARLRITMIDKEAGRVKEYLYRRYTQMEKACELVPVEADIQLLESGQADFLFDNRGKCDVAMVYVCLDDDSHALSAALMIRQRIKNPEVPIVIRMDHNAGLATLLRGEKGSQGSLYNLHVFGLFDHTCTPDLISRCTYEVLARAIHENYVRNERAKGHTPETNPSMVPWADLGEILRQSNRRAAEHIRVKLDAIGCDIAITTAWDTPRFEFTPDEIEMLAQMEHESWAEEKLSEGWKYRPTKDPEKKTSPYLVPWNDLPEEEKDKDRDQVRGLPQFLAKARFEIYRLKKPE